MTCLPLIASISHAEERALSSRERREVIRAISLIRNLGYESIALSLQDRLGSDEIDVETSWPQGFYAQTSCPMTGRRVITLSATTIPDDRSPYYKLDRGMGPLNLFEDRAWLASILAHEWLHTTQGWLFLHTEGRIYSVRETPAWKWQVEFLTTYMNALGSAQSEQLRVSELVQQAQEVLSSL